jgi:hypothetical protein
MADWLIHFLIQFGGYVAVLALALILMGKWLWRKINAALESYTTAYFNGQAAIDVRIRNLEKLAEEQATLTRTVEGIKGEFAAQAKSRDNRWEFRKDVYVNLIKLLSDFLFLRIEYLALINTQKNIDPAALKQLQEVEKQQKANLDKSAVAYKEYMTQQRIAQLVPADNALLAQFFAQSQITTTIAPFPGADDEQVNQEVSVLSNLLGQLARGGRKELWDTPEPVT